MDNHIFRSSLNGFNRQDVTAYIEKSQREAAERMAELEAQLDQLRKNENELRSALETCTQERDALSEQLADLEKEHDKTKIEMTAQLQDMQNEVTNARKEKESVAQLELEARKRAEELLAETRAQAEELLAQARSQAQALLTAANEQAENTIDASYQRAEQIRADMEKQAKRTGAEVDELISSVETIVSHVTAELRKMDVAVAQLPINFNHLKDGMKNVIEQASDYKVAEK